MRMIRSIEVKAKPNPEVFTPPHVHSSMEGKGTCRLRVLVPLLVLNVGYHSPLPVLIFLQLVLQCLVDHFKLGQA